MRRTTPTAPIEPASPLSSPIKGRHAPGLTLYALGIEGIYFAGVTLSLLAALRERQSFSFPFPSPVW